MRWIVSSDDSACLLVSLIYSHLHLPLLNAQVVEKPARDETALAQLVALVQSFSSSDTGIVYCLTRKETEQVAAELCKHGIRAASYHAYMDDKEATHHAWVHNRLQVVVATIAFGLGINKPDVRFVIHYTLSKVRLSRWRRVVLWRCSAC